MEAEAEPLLKALGLEKDEPPGISAPAPCVTFSGKAFGLDLHIVCNGAQWHGITRADLTKCAAGTLHGMPRRSIQPAPAHHVQG